MMATIDSPSQYYAVQYCSERAAGLTGVTLARDVLDVDVPVSTTNLRLSEINYKTLFLFFVIFCIIFSIFSFYLDRTSCEFCMIRHFHTIVLL